LNRFRIIAFTHKTLGVDPVGKLHIDDAELAQRLQAAKAALRAAELAFISTCNRVEFLLVADQELDTPELKKFLAAAYPSWTEEKIAWAVSFALVYNGEEAISHLFAVASSIDSLVVGEREIITQVRNAYEVCRKLGLTGDLIRLIIQKTIETAKQVYTETAISKNPVSVVSLAYRRLRELNVNASARFLIIGSGVTNTAMCRYLKKHGFKNFTVFNRTLAHAETLAKELSAKAFPLAELTSFKGGFDVMVTCTGSQESVITLDVYRCLAGDDRSKKIVIDLAVPNDLAEEVVNNYDINLIAVNNLQDLANKNLKEREKELSACGRIIGRSLEEFRVALKERQVELAMSEVPRMVKEIREIAVNEVFAKDISSLDPNSKEVLEKVLSYMEKKYISVPMKMAKDILIEESNSK
jgi:glutamyl-tRNA reductase